LEKGSVSLSEEDCHHDPKREGFNPVAVCSFQPDQGHGRIILVILTQRLATIQLAGRVSLDFKNSPTHIAIQ